MAFPEKNSAMYQVLECIAEFGPTTSGNVLEVTSHSRSTVIRAFNAGYLDRVLADNDAYLYSVKPFVAAALKRSAYDGEIAQPRSINLLQRPELKGYFGSIKRGLREPIREVSYFRSSSQCLPRG